MAYDIIGDIHGQADKLIALLREMGYREERGAWRHPTRKAMFVGDFIDRGPGQLETLRIVRGMVEAGSAEAVMGNHEFNAIVWHTPDPLSPGEYLRPRHARNLHQHVRFLEEVGSDSPLHKSWIDWFMTLPLWLEKPGFRVVHACWHPEFMAQLAPHLGPNNTLTPELLLKAGRHKSPEFVATEAICKGLEIDLPAPMTFTDEEGTVRGRTRVRWWDADAVTYRRAALIGKAEADQLPDTPLPADARVAYDDLKPVFFGHYWAQGTPRILTPKACCVDFSAAIADKPLVAYRWDGEAELTNDHLVAVYPACAPRPAGPRPVGKAF